jgi:hypothetical protein
LTYRNRVKSDKPGQSGETYIGSFAGLKAKYIQFGFKNDKLMTFNVTWEGEGSAVSFEKIKEIISGAVGKPMSGENARVAWRFTDGSGCFVGKWPSASFLSCASAEDSFFHEVLKHEFK